MKSLCDLFYEKITNFGDMMKLFYKFDLEIKVFDYGLWLSSMVIVVDTMTLVNGL